MNFLGMGMPELVVIMVVAFLALGPSKSIDMARSAGKMMRDLRRTFDEVTSAVKLDDDDPPPPNRPGPSAPTTGNDPPPANQS